MTARLSLSRRALLASSALAALAAARGPTARAGGRLRAAFIYIGPLDADLWSYAHDQGRRELERRTGIETAFTADVTAAGAERVLREYARQGYGAIFSTSFDFAEAALRVARDHPEAIFEQATGMQTAPNLGVYNGRIYQAWFLAGIVAAGATRTGQLGYVAPYAIPEVVRHLNAFTLGARFVDERVTVRPRWIGTWFDPTVEAAAARALADQGADVIASEADSSAANRAADALGLASIGYNAVPPGSPASILTAPVWRWEAFYERAVGDILAGQWSNAPVWWGMCEGLVELAPFAASVGGDVRALIERLRASLLIGRDEVFAGPIRDNAGALRVSAGRAMTDAELLTFDWLVEGVIGPLPAGERDRPGSDTTEERWLTRS